MSVIEPPIDERLDYAFQRRRYPQVYIVDDGMAYAWDKADMPTQTTFAKWLETKDYKNSIQQFKAPAQIRNDWIMFRELVLRRARFYIGWGFENMLKGN